VASQEPKKTNGAAQPTGGLILTLQTSKRIQISTKKPIRTAESTNDRVVQILADPTDPTAVILFGRGPGVSTVTLTDGDGGKDVLVVTVEPDLELLRTLIRRAVPTASVTLLPGVGNSIILTGNVARAEDVDTILRIAASAGAQVVNGMQVGGVHQVQLDVTVARVDRTKARNRGFNFIVNGTTVSFGSVLGGLVAPGGGGGGVQSSAAGVGIIPAAATAQPINAVNLVLGVVPAQFQGLLQALKTEGLAKLLSEPKLVTQSGRPARFLSGGRQATLSAASGINGPGVVYEDIGTELEFLPIVYGNGKIYLEVAPRVRGVNQGLGIVTSFGAVPGFDEQSVRTSIVLESGQTFAIGGLIQSNVQSSIVKVPVLGEIPFIGAAFSVISQTEQENELVILVTPHLVDPMDCSQIPGRLPGAETRKPDDFELYLESLMEAPRGPRNVFEGKRYRGAWMNDQSAGEYPCGPLYNPNGGHGGHGGYGHGGNCNTGNCAPATGHQGHATIAPKTMPAMVEAAPSGMSLTMPNPVSTEGSVEVMPLQQNPGIGSVPPPTLK
jgi:pilus assembly protein CpaC